MLSKLDAAHARYEHDEDATAVTRFTLLPTHGCGSSRFVVLDGMCMVALIPRIKTTHRDFYDSLRKRRNKK